MVEFIAEIGNNHNGSLARAKALMELAQDCGFNAVKFQLFRLDRLYREPVLSEKRISGMLYEIPFDWLFPLRSHADALGLRLGFSVFDPASTSWAAHVADFLKISSYEWDWTPLLQAVACQRKETWVSLGMANERESENVIRFFVGKVPLVVLHCVSSYPCLIADCNLAAIESLRNIAQPHLGKIVGMIGHLPLRVGWSDHSLSSEVIVRAVRRWHAEAIELHFDCDGEGAEWQHSWTPERARQVISICRMDGSGVKRPMPSEMAELSWRRDSYDGLRPTKKIP